jgi:CheY-like chemotaxis protein
MPTFGVFFARIKASVPDPITRYSGNSLKAGRTLMLPGTRILVIDDEPLLAENLRAYLERHRALVRIATSGEQALQDLEDFTPDIVLTDYALPGLDGIETFRRIRSQLGRCGCVLMTASPTEAIRQEAASTGIRTVLEKPFPLCALDAPISDQPGSPAHWSGQERRNNATRRASERRGVAPSGLPPAGGERRRYERRRDHLHRQDSGMPADAERF